MLLKLAVRNIKSHPFRAAATITAIAVAVAMIFSMLSFKSAVYQYIFQTETADAGESDIVIASNSASARIIFVEPLYSLDGSDEPRIAEICPTLSLYALYGGEYVRLRGFESGKLESLHEIEAVEGSVETLAAYPDTVAVSRQCADYFGLSVGDAIPLSLGSNSTDLYVGVIAENNGYFLKDSPYLIIGTSSEGISRLIGESTAVYNEIYIRVRGGADITELIKDISALNEYSAMKVDVSKDSSYIEEQTDSLTAPVVLAGAAVLLLGVACIAVLFLLGEKEKRAYISKLRVIGATKNQIFTVFLLESLFLAFTGALIGTALASGVFIALLKITLSSTLTFEVSALKLLLSAAAGVVVALASSLAPLLKAFKASVRDNLNSVQVRSRKSAIALALPILLAAIAFIVENTVTGAKGVLSAANIILALFALASASALGIKGVAFALSKLKNGNKTKLKPLIKTKSRSKNPKTENHPIFQSGSNFAKAAYLGETARKKNACVAENKKTEPERRIPKKPLLRLAALSMAREKRFVKQTVLLSVGMTVSMALFMAWSLTTSIFNSYINDFSNMVFVSNVQSNVNVGQFEETEGVSGATSMVWRNAEISVGGQMKTINLLGSENILNMVNFQFVSPKQETEANLFGGGNYIVLDKAMQELYKVNQGDVIDLEIDGVKKPFTVAGIVSHRLFSGNYAIVSAAALLENFDIKPDTVLVIADDASAVAGELRTRFAKFNYYVIEVLEAYKWDRQSMDAVFSLIGTLAVIISLFIFLVAAATVGIGRSGAERERNTLLVAGTSKNSLLFYEFVQHALTAFTSLVLSIAASVALTAALIGALRLFGLYFEFMYSAGVVLGVGAVFCVLYTLLPLVLRYKKGYNIKKTA
jgi:ABC-type antimicrobial peptide transport system permease subunit